MPIMSSKVQREYDADSAVELRDPDGAALTADTSGTGVALNRLGTAYWDNGEQPNGVILIPVNVTAGDWAGADEVYDIYIEVDNTSDFSSGAVKEVARLKAIPAVGYYEIAVPAATIKGIKSTATHIRYRLDVTGATCSLTFGAWLTFLKV